MRLSETQGLNRTQEPHTNSTDLTANQNFILDIQAPTNRQQPKSLEDSGTLTGSKKLSKLEELPPEIHSNYSRFLKSQDLIKLSKCSHTMEYKLLHDSFNRFIKSVNLIHPKNNRRMNSDGKRKIFHTSDENMQLHINYAIELDKKGHTIPTDSIEHLASGIRGQKDINILYSQYNDLLKLANKHYQKAKNFPMPQMIAAAAELHCKGKTFPAEYLKSKYETCGDSTKIQEIFEHSEHLTANKNQ